MITIPLAEILTADSRKKIGACLQGDGVIAYPTDTLYGLGGNFYSPDLLARIDRLKGRRDQPYSVAVGSLSMLQSLAVDIADLFYERLYKLLPGKFTFLFAANPAIDRRLLKNSDKIGIRMPGLPSLLQLLDALAVPLVSTSANRSGRPPLNDPAVIAGEFPEIDLLIDGGILPVSAGSTLVDITVMPPAILRAGDGMERLLQVLDDESGRER